MRPSDRKSVIEESQENINHPDIDNMQSGNGRSGTLEMLPPRTRFYALAPLEFGKPFVESFSNYVVRIARAHSVELGDLAQYVNLLRQDTSCGRLGCTPMNAFNGGEMTRPWLSVLEEGTQIRELRNLTMLPFEGILSYRRIFHKFRRWCPSCYDESRKREAVVYDPLLWSVSSVDICAIHLLPLESECPACGSRMRFFSATLHAGYCSCCGSWLGRIQNKAKMSVEEFERRIWYAKAVGGLLSISSQFADESKSALFINNWHASVEIAVKRFPSAVLQVCGISAAVRDNILDDPPVMDVFLRMCFGLKIDVESLIDDSFDPYRLVQHFSQAIQGMELQRSPISRTELRTLLEVALQEDPPPSVEELAERWGYRGANRLRAVDSELCRRISKRNRQASMKGLRTRTESSKVLESRLLLEASLSQELPDPYGKIAKRAGCSASALKARFPQLCLAINQKIEEVRQSRLTRARQFLEEALTESLVPSLKELAKRAGFLCSISLNRNFPELCELLLQRAKSERSEMSMKLERKLKSYLVETPPPTVREIAKRVLLSQATLAESHPKLVAQLGRRSRIHRRESAAIRQNQLYKEVKQIVESDLLNGQETVYGKRLRTLISENCPRNWTLLWRALEEARRPSSDTVLYDANQKKNG
jgi:AraC-like DNA-binding protein